METISVTARQAMSVEILQRAGQPIISREDIREGLCPLQRRVQS
jgi:hypothetical protein